MDENQKEIKGFAQFLFSVSPAEFTLLATVIGLILVAPLDGDEQQALGNFFESVGQTMLTYYSQEAVLLQKRIDKNQFA